MFQTIIIIPLTNALVFLTSFLWGSLGLAVIALTILVKIVLFPFSYSTTKNQIALKKIQPLVDDIKKKYTDKNEQARKMMELYKEHKTNPFAGCLPILIQIPIIIGLYQVFLKGIAVDGTLLYSFVSAPEVLHTYLLGINLMEKSLIIAIIAGVSQYIQLKLSPAFQTNKNAEPATDPQTMMMENMQKMMIYLLPIMITVFSAIVPAAVALYWVVTNVFTIGQEIYIHKKVKQQEQ